MILLGERLKNTNALKWFVDQADSSDGFCAPQEHTKYFDMERGFALQTTGFPPQKDGQKAKPDSKVGLASMKTEQVAGNWPTTMATAAASLFPDGRVKLVRFLSKQTGQQTPLMELTAVQY